MQGNAQLLVGFQQFRIHFIQTLGHVFLALGRGIVGNRVVVDFRVAHVGPVRLFHLEPATVGFQTPLQHPFRLFLNAGQAGDNVFIQAGLERVGFDVCYESVLVFPFDQLVHLLVGGRHDRRSVFSHRGLSPLVSPAASRMGCRSDIISLCVAVVARPVSTPCNRFLDDGLPRLSPVTEQKKQPGSIASGERLYNTRVK